VVGEKEGGKKKQRRKRAREREKEINETRKRELSEVERSKR